jgi:hypothetical protein
LNEVAALDAVAWLFPRFGFALQVLVGGNYWVGPAPESGFFGAKGALARDLDARLSLGIAF